MIKNLTRLFLLSLFVTVLSVMSLAAPAQADVTISEVRVEGAQRIEPSTVLSYLKIKPGDRVSNESLDYALKSLFATGLFADLSLRQEGDALIVQVVENPVINEIAFEGNDRVEDEELFAEIQLRPRQVFTRTKVQADVSRLHQIYRRNGRFSVRIEPKIIQLDQNRVNLVFEIEEGEVTKVKSVRFVGNKRFSDALLRSEIVTKETAWYRFITADDRYDPDRLAYDQELLRRFYLANGYADFRLLSAIAELSGDREHFYVTFTVEEGERYKVGEVKIESDLRDFDVSVLNESVKVESGEYYNADLVQETVDALTDKMGDLQYAFVNIRPDIERNRDERIISITFKINESPRVFVEEINVSGNVRTLDKVVRREMLLVEGDPFNRSKLARSEQRIKDLDYFETVNMDIKQGSAPDKTVVDIDVAEKSTGELSIGAGFSTNDGVLGDFRIRERNFLGKGQDLLFAATLASERTEFNVSFTEPYFLNRDVSAGFDLFNINRDFQDESSYDQRKTGAGLRVGYPLSERWRQVLRYRAERNEITDVQGTASRFILDQEGTRDTSAISQNVTYDSRNSKILPTDGLYYWVETELAGLGGDAQYMQAKTGASYYYPLADQWTVNLLGETGAIKAYNDETVQINERFFIGGATLRGFEQAGIGPRDIRTEDSLGGNFFYRGTAELSMPTPFPEDLGLQAHVFTDFGSLWEIDDVDSTVFDESSLRASAGFGVSWRSPFGPIRADLATPYLSEDLDQKEAFRFNFGTRF